jgi:hypothetical protein
MKEIDIRITCQERVYPIGRALLWPMTATLLARASQKVTREDLTRLLPGGVEVRAAANKIPSSGMAPPMASFCDAVASCEWWVHATASTTGAANALLAIESEVTP